MADALIETVAEIVRQGYALDVSAEEVARVAILATLARMRDDVRDHTLYRRTVENITADFAKRHGLETHDGQ